MNVKGDRKEHIVMQMPSQYHTEAKLQIIIAQELWYKHLPAADHVWTVTALVGAWQLWSNKLMTQSLKDIIKYMME